MKRKSLANVFSCEFCEICQNTFLLIIVVSMVVEEDLADETVNYDTEIKLYP